MRYVDIVCSVSSTNKASIDIVCNRWGLALIICIIAWVVAVALLPVSLGSGRRAAVSIGLLFVALFGAMKCKKKAVGFCLDQCVAEMVQVCQAFEPDVVLAYSWGGAAAVLALERGLWHGPLLLLAPAQEALVAHAGLHTPSLRKACCTDDRSVPPDSGPRRPSCVMVVHGLEDPVISVKHR